jgi:hypothetical protein
MNCRPCVLPFRGVPASMGAWPDLYAISNLRVPRSSSCEGRALYGRQPRRNLKLALYYRLNGATIVACSAMCPSMAFNTSARVAVAGRSSFPFRANNSNA